MQVVQSTIGRFHSFDLAKQLEQRGLLRTIFSGYPRIKLRKVGVPQDRIRTFPWLHAPYMYVNPQHPNLRRFWARQDAAWFDRFVAANLPPCDLFHGISGSALRSGRTAQKRGAKYICDRGSTHIRYQNEALTEEFERYGVRFHGLDTRTLETEQAEYETADGITVPSRFVRQTFIDKGIPPEKLHVVPYGVELSQFRPVATPAQDHFQVLFAGSISARKGVRYLAEAFRRFEHPHKRLVFLGGCDIRIEQYVSHLRKDKNILFAGHQPQAEVVRFMSESHVLVLPSVEEGLALVQAQALACGCPVIATPNAGAEDLFKDGEEGFIVPVRNPDAIADRLQLLASDPHRRARMSAAALSRVQTLGGWNEYGNAAVLAFESVLEGASVAV